MNSINHTKSLLEYTLKLNTAKRFKDKLTCHSCNKKLEVGERIVRRYSSRNRNRYYHKDCALKLNVIVEEARGSIGQL